MNKTKSLTMLFALAFIVLTMVGSASAYDFDNTKSYNPETKEVTITNAFGLGSRIATIQLLSPLVNNVMPGKDRMVAEMRFNVDKGSIPYNQAFKSMKMINIKTNGEFNRNFTYKYKKILGVDSIPEYRTNCTVEAGNVTKCNRHIAYYRNVERYEWIIINEKDFSDLPNNDVIIGIFTDVYNRDYVEWIPTYFGVEINEWAVWTSALNNGLMAYFDGNSTVNMIPYNQEINLTDLEGTPIYGSTENCKIGKCINLTLNKNFMIKQNTKFKLNTVNTTINFWVSGQSNGASGNPYFMGSPTNGKQQIGWDTPTKVYAGSSWTGGTLSDLSDGNVGYNNYFMITYRINDTHGTFFFNGTWQDWGSAAGVTDENLYFGNIFNLVFDWYGQIDEIGIWNRSLTPTEVSDLWNNGAGITYQSSFDNAPNVNLISPSDGYATNINSILFNCTANDDFNLTNMTLYINGIANITSIFGVLNGNITTQLTFPEGTYNWSCGAKDDINQQTITANRTFTVDSIKPNIRIGYPTTTIVSLSNGQNVSLNYTITDTNINTCWREYNNINTTISCTQNSSFNYTVGVNTITIWANDTTGNLNYSTRSWSIAIIELIQNFSNSTNEGNTETFSINITIDSITYPNILGYLYYNNTYYIGTKSGSGNDIVYSTSLVVPNIDAQANKTFYWVFFLTNTTSDTLNFNSSSNNQTINTISLDDCSAYTNKIFNYTLYDERNENIISGTTYNTTIQITLRIYAYGSNTLIAGFYQNYSKLSSATICLQNQLASSSKYRLYSQVRYNGDDYAARFYYIDNMTITNSSFPQNISLYDIKDTYATLFKFYYQSPDGSTIGSKVSNLIININKDFGNDTYHTVENFKTDNYGSGTVNIDTEAVKYRITVYKEGQLLSIFDNIAIFCNNKLTGDCTITLRAASSYIPSLDMENFKNLDYNIATNRTLRSIVTTFQTSDNSASTISINVTKLDQYQNISVCSDSIYSNVGTLSCIIPVSSGNNTYVYELYNNGELVVRNIYSLSAKANELYQGSIVIIVFVMLVAIPLLFVGNIIMMIVAFIIGIGCVMALFSLGSSMLGATSALVWVIILFGIIIWKINHRGES